MSDIVTLNGYKIKDEKAVRSYETIALMKADTKLKEGYHVKTKGYYEANDGGNAEYIIVDDETLVDDGGSIHVLTNGLRAILLNTEIYPEMFGAYGDGIHDDHNAIQNVINYALLNYINVVGMKSYKIDTTLEIVGNTPETNIDVYLNKVIYTGNDFAIDVKYAQYLTLIIDELTASNGGGLKSIPSESPQRMQYCKISLRKCTYKTYGIYIRPTNNRWVNENEFIRSRFFGNNGSSSICVYVEDGTGGAESTTESNMFRWIGNENPNTKTFVFNKAQNTVIEYPRYQESGHLCDTSGTNQLLFILKTQLKNTFFNFSNDTYGRIITAKSVFSDIQSVYDYFNISSGYVIPVNENNYYSNISNTFQTEGVVDFTNRDGYEMPQYMLISGSSITQVDLPQWLLLSSAHPIYLRFGDNAQTNLTFNCGSYSFTYDGVKLTTGHWYRIRFVQTLNKFIYEEISVL